MQSLFLAVSGSGGGSNGPQNIYPILQQHCPIENATFLSIETVRDNIHDTVQRTLEVALKHLDSYSGIYLIGYSMGGAVAVQAAQKLNQIAGDKVKGIILLATQSDGLQLLKELRVPVLFYHGKEDSIFRAWEIETIYKRYNGPKAMIEIEGLGHNLAHTPGQQKSKSYSEDLAKHVTNEIADFFFRASLEETSLKTEIISKDLLISKKDSFLDKVYSYIFQQGRPN